MVRLPPPFFFIFGSSASPPENKEPAKHRKPGSRQDAKRHPRPPLPHQPCPREESAKAKISGAAPPWALHQRRLCPDSDRGVATEIHARITRQAGLILFPPRGFVFSSFPFILFQRAPIPAAPFIPPGEEKAAKKEPAGPRCPLPPPLPPRREPRSPRQGPGFLSLTLRPAHFPATQAPSLPTRRPLLVSACWLFRARPSTAISASPKIPFPVFQHGASSGGRWPQRPVGARLLQCGLAGGEKTSASVRVVL